jgi:hypothetical protein
VDGFLGDTRLLGENTSILGKHRTEGTDDFLVYSVRRRYSVPSCWTFV